MVDEGAAYRIAPVGRTKKASSIRHQRKKEDDVTSNKELPIVSRVSILEVRMRARVGFVVVVCGRRGEITLTVARTPPRAWVLLFLCLRMIAIIVYATSCCVVP